MFLEVALKLFPEAPRLCTVLVSLFSGQVYTVLRKLRDVSVVDMMSCHRLFLVPAKAMRPG